MLLAIDIGNTNLTFGLYAKRELQLIFRAKTDRSKTADEHAALLRQLLELHEVGPSSVGAAIMASVVPQLTDVVAEAVRIACNCKPILVGPGIKTGISVLYENPHDVGADRIVNAVAAYSRFEQSAIVVDFGTATTFDCISPKGEYLGGIIVPGIQVSLDALTGRAAKLRPVEVAAPPTVVGRNMTHSLQSGIVHGYGSLVDGMIGKIEAELGYRCKVIATGGLAPLLAQHTKSLTTVDQTLTLEGLRILHERNSPDTSLDEHTPVA